MRPRGGADGGRSPGDATLHRFERGGALPVILVLLLLIGAGGGYNYWRNLGAEQDSPRPYRGYSDAELGDLVTAYEAEVKRLDARYAAARDGRSVHQASSNAHISEQIKSYENARRSGQAVRERAADVAQQEAVLRDLRAEQALRAQRGAGLTLHWRRLTKL